MRSRGPSLAGLKLCDRKEAHARSALQGLQDELFDKLRAHQTSSGHINKPDHIDRLWAH
jgi:hypothetical protein